MAGEDSEDGGVADLDTLHHKWGGVRDAGME